jgi:Pin2-interacting protein X1
VPYSSQCSLPIVADSSCLLLQAEQAHKLRDWTTGMVGYDAILTGLREITARGSSSSSSSSDDEDSSGQGGPSGYDSDSDTSGAAPAKPAAAAARQDSQKAKSKKAAAAAAAAADDEKKKKKRSKKQRGSAAAADTDAPAAKRAKKADSSSSESGSGSESESSGSDSDSDAEPAGAAAGGIKVPAKVSRVKAASHLGRYQKREKAKTVRNYSANDLAAILGLPGSAPPVANGEGAAGWAAAVAVSNPAGAGAGSNSSSSSGSDSSDSESDSEAGAERNSSDQRLRPSTPPGSDSPPSRSQQRGLGDTANALNPDADEELQPVSDDLEEGVAGQKVWWRSLFVRAGRTGGGAPAAAAATAGGGKQRINISGFQEEDQTNLYMQVCAWQKLGGLLSRSAMLCTC